MMRALAIALVLATAATPLAAAPKPDRFTAAVAKPDRPAADVALDAGRKPAEVLRFMKLTPGMKVLDFLTGTGYYAEIMAGIVGPKGQVLAYAPATYNAEKTNAAFAAMAPRARNVKLVNVPPLAPNSLDMIFTNLNYHDLYFESVEYKIPRTDPDVVLKSMFAALKPGGIFALIDHVGPAGDTRAVVDKVHRIDPATVKADFARAGFVLDGESSLLRVPGDDYTKNVFDPAVRGKTDRMVLRFRKPLK
jgi:predicted methyltransferase